MLDFSAINEAKLQFHYAAQLLATTTSLLPAQPESAHTALVWHSGERTIQTKPIKSNVPVVVRFNPETFNLTVAAAADTFQFELKHKSLGAGLDWLAALLGELGLEKDQLSPLAYPTYDFPFHPIALGAKFDSLDQSAVLTLIELFNYTDKALIEVTCNHPNASPVRLWPHHFDLALLLHYNSGQTIGMGFSPGDQSYDRPYWYVSPYPYPQELPELAIGHWHTSGWTGAVWTLTATSQINQAAIRDFFHNGMIAAEKSMGIER